MANWHYTMGRLGFFPPEEAFARGASCCSMRWRPTTAARKSTTRSQRSRCTTTTIATPPPAISTAAVALEPEDAEALRFQSVVYKILGRTEEAVRIARAATVRAPEVAMVWNGLGDALLAAGRNAEAIDALKRAIALQPGYGPALERLELAHVRLGELDSGGGDPRSRGSGWAASRERADAAGA